MNKIQVNIYISAEECGIENGKICVKKGSFYFNNKKYEIENGDIKCL